MGIAFTRHIADFAAGPAARIIHPGTNYHLTPVETDRHLAVNLISILDSVGRILDELDDLDGALRLSDAAHDRLRPQVGALMTQLETLIDEADLVDIVQRPE